MNISQGTNKNKKKKISFKISRIIGLGVLSSKTLPQKWENGKSEASKLFTLIKNLKFLCKTNP